MQEQSKNDPELRFVRQGTVLERTNISRSTLYELINAGQFPRPMKICGGRINLWPEHEVTAWLVARMADREAAA